MEDDKKSITKKLAKKYRELSSEYPEAKLALDLHPLVGIGMSALDAAASAAEGKYGDAALEALGVVPGVKYIPGMGLTKGIKKYASKKANAARNIDRVSDSVSYGGSKADKIREDIGLKKGGAVKPRGVGKALRGWGRGAKR